ncbi:interferon-induced very large GTPase 1-like [Chanos chanos]|uniref:Interferon-induced very large GTPase 1-like n=1 Tax=Chanos chanos TaxID=29144 RepID=A0A6J2WYD0_CHACN|nr:interferon-induced very large GTPase 1-like [Chanos chanos]
MEINRFSLQLKKPQTETELVNIFLQELLTMDYRARYTVVREQIAQMDQTKISTENEYEEERDEGDFDALIYGETVVNDEKEEKSHIHPMDVQMAVFHCADRFLQQFMVTKLSQCQYALPLLVPNPFTQQIEFPLWTFRQIKKSWRSTDKSGKVTSKTEPICKAETPMVFFLRLGSVSSSKSQLMNSLINEKHNTFFHRHCPGSSKTRHLMDGVVEIAWYCPSGKDADHFTDCVAFCNLHGDAVTNEKQVEILSENATVNVVLHCSLNENGQSLLQRLFHSPTPLICLLSEENSPLKRIRTGKYRLGLKDRNHADVSAELRRAIRECLSISPRTFKLEELVKNTQITVDEESGSCKKGKEAALQIMNLLKGEDLTAIKQKHLPCQGKLWHDWCQKNKELHQLQGTNVEATKSNTQEQMRQVREQQRASGFSELLNLFVGSLQSLLANEKRFFLKWVGILLDDLTSDKLSHLRLQYDEQWSVVLKFKKKHVKLEQLNIEQNKLESISDNLKAATCGVEHIIREMGQIYEAWASDKNTKTDRNDKNLSSLPDLAAELMISGHPMELMDGDAAHVPLIWVTAVLDEVIKRLGEQRVFVLSVLGLQSTGKSTMLNAMFGLQFAVSAGRCTRGAFMQLVRVTEEMMAELKFDYILVVDTEGLRALELSGRATRHHDRELATFVVGLGNMTLINIFGENPAEMQDILQIVVQAFLRMKKVRLSPSCMFVHQNVGDITAEERNMEGKRRLREKLDEMTKLAAKEEVCDVECFSNVISFDVQTDVKYFAQLWEGSPPMAPPNPSYSENIQDLKRHILSQSSKSSGMTLSQFKTTICDLWNALLNENFVFSFKNTLEIAVYRKLETQYGKWTWSLRSAMLSIENKLQNRIANGKLFKAEETELVASMRQTKEEVENSMKQYFEGDRDTEILTQWRGGFETKSNDFYNALVKKTKRQLDELISQKKACEMREEKKLQYESKLFEQIKELMLNLESKTHDDEVLRQKFDEVWSKCFTDLEKNTVWKDVKRNLSKSHKSNLVHEQEKKGDYKNFSNLPDYSEYVIMKPLFEEDQNAQEAEKKTTQTEQRSSEHSALTDEDQVRIKTFIKDTIQQTEKFIEEELSAKAKYESNYIRHLTDLVKDRVKALKLQRYEVKEEFTVNLSLCVCHIAADTFKEFNKVFEDSNDQKLQYYSMFKSFCKGATSTAVFGGFICSKLEHSILQAVYEKAAIDLAAEIKSGAAAFNGNRSKLERHILRSLAEEESLESFMMYINKPEKHFKQFITDEVNKYILQKNNQTVLGIIIGNLKLKQQCIISAVHSATQEVKNNSGDANKWLKSFSDRLKDELRFTEKSGFDLTDVTDFDTLEEVIIEGLDNIISKLEKNFRESPLKMEKFRERPDEILIKHFCRCCWVQCPFCKAVCTNTIEGHDGDHSVPFHRPVGINQSSESDERHARGSVRFCTTLVASDDTFQPSQESDKTVPYKQYRTAGLKYASWSITPDLSEQPYWQWFLCQFQTTLEERYSLKFQGPSEIPSQWRKYTKEDAIRSLYETDFTECCTVASDQQDNVEDHSVSVRL